MVCVADAAVSRQQRQRDSGRRRRTAAVAGSAQPAGLANRCLPRALPLFYAGSSGGCEIFSGQYRGYRQRQSAVGVGVGRWGSRESWDVVAVCRVVGLSSCPYVPVHGSIGLVAGGLGAAWEEQHRLRRASLTSERRAGEAGRDGPWAVGRGRGPMRGPWAGGRRARRPAKLARSRFAVGPYQSFLGRTLIQGLIFLRTARPQCRDMARPSVL